MTVLHEQMYGCVSTNAVKIPNVCEHFGVDCTNLEEFMEREKWRF